MKKKIQDISEEKIEESSGQLITRKEAIKKTAYIALSAATMMILLSKQSQAGPQCSQPAPPPKNNPGGGGRHQGPWK